MRGFGSVMGVGTLGTQGSVRPNGLAPRAGRREADVARRIALLAAALGALVVAAPALAVPTYTAIALGTLGGTFSYGSAINGSGEVTGNAYTTGNAAEHAFLYSGGGMTDLGTLGGTTSAGYGINGSGEVTGFSYTTGNVAQHAFLYSGGGMTDLGTLGGTYSAGYGINDSGEMAGYAYTTGNAATHAFLYSGGGMTDLGTLGGTNSFGYGINDSGEVTGNAYTTGNAAEHAFLYSGGGMTDLGTLGGTTSAGYGINGSGEVTGFSYTTGNVAQHAFLYSGGGMTDLGTLGGANSFGWGVNGIGEVAGMAYNAGNAQRAFLYDSGMMYDLNTLVTAGLGGVSLYEARGINDAGQIVAYGCGTTSCQAYLLDPVVSSAPEPGTLALLGVGLTGAGFSFRRMSRRPFERKQRRVPEGWRGLFISTLSAIVAFVVLTPAQAGVLFDGTFASWTFDATGTATAKQESSNGNPDEGLDVTTISGAEVYGTAVKTDFSTDAALEGSPFTLSLDVLSGPGAFGAGQAIQLLTSKTQPSTGSSWGPQAFH